MLLQINKIINVAEPVHSREEESNNRLLKLLLSDGTNYITAYEHSPISNLSVTSPIGTKVLIRDTLFNYGYIELRPECVYIIGGHNYKQPSNYIPSPSSASNNNTLFQIKTETQINKPNFPIVKNEVIKSEILPTNDSSVVINISPDLSQPKAVKDLNQLKRPVPVSNTLSSTNNNITPIKRTIQQQQQQQIPPPQSLSPLINNNKRIKINENINTLKPPSSPFTTINEIITQSKPNHFYTMATLASVVSGFQFSKGIYELKGYIEDGTSRVEAQISNECLNDLFKITAEELMMIAKSGSSARMKLQEITGNFSKILGKTEGMFELSYDPQSSPQFVVLNVSKPSVDIIQQFYEYVLLNL